MRAEIGAPQSLGLQAKDWESNCMEPRSYSR